MCTLCLLQHIQWQEKLTFSDQNQLWLGSSDVETKSGSPPKPCLQSWPTEKTQLVPARWYELLKTLSLIASFTKSSSLIRITTGFSARTKEITRGGSFKSHNCNFQQKVQFDDNKHDADHYRGGKAGGMSNILRSLRHYKGVREISSNKKVLILEWNKGLKVSYSNSAISPNNFHKASS